MQEMIALEGVNDDIQEKFKADWVKVDRVGDWGPSGCQDWVSDRRGLLFIPLR